MYTNEPGYLQMSELLRVRCRVPVAQIYVTIYHRRRVHQVAVRLQRLAHQEWVRLLERIDAVAEVAKRRDAPLFGQELDDLMVLLEPRVTDDNDV